MMESFADFCKKKFDTFSQEIEFEHNNRQLELSDKITKLELRNGRLIEQVEKLSKEIQSLQKSKDQLEVKNELLENSISSRQKCSMCESLQKTLDSMREVYTKGLYEKDKIISWMETKLKKYQDEGIPFPNSSKKERRTPFKNICPGEGCKASPDSTIRGTPNKPDGSDRNQSSEGVGRSTDSVGGDQSGIRWAQNEEGQVNRGQKRQCNVEEISPPFSKRSKLLNSRTEQKSKIGKKKRVIVPDTCMDQSRSPGNLMNITEIDSNDGQRFTESQVNDVARDNRNQQREPSRDWPLTDVDKNKTKPVEQKMSKDVTISPRCDASSKMKVVPETLDPMELMFGSSASESGNDEDDEEAVTIVTQDEMKEQPKYSLLSVLVSPENSDNDEEEEELTSPNMLSAIKLPNVLPSDDCKGQEGNSREASPKHDGIETLVDPGQRRERTDNGGASHRYSEKGAEMKENLTRNALNREGSKRLSPPKKGSVTNDDDCPSPQLLKCRKSDVVSNNDSDANYSLDMGEESPLLIKSRSRSNLFAVSGATPESEEWTRAYKKGDKKSRRGRGKLEVELDPDSVISPRNLRQTTLSQAFPNVSLEDCAPKISSSSDDFMRKGSVKPRSNARSVLVEDDEDVFQRPSSQRKRSRQGRLPFKTPSSISAASSNVKPSPGPSSTNTKSSSPVTSSAKATSTSSLSGKDSSMGMNDVSNSTCVSAIDKIREKPILQLTHSDDEDTVHDAGNKFGKTLVKPTRRSSRKDNSCRESEINGSLDPDLELSLLCQDKEKDPLFSPKHRTSKESPINDSYSCDKENIDPNVPDSVASLTDFRIEDLQGGHEKDKTPLTSTCVDEMDTQAIPCSYRSVKFGSGKKKLVVSPPNSPVRDEDGCHGMDVSLEDSFDRVPSKPQPGYAYVDVVRKQNERRQLTAYDCKECREYYEACGLSEEEIRQKKQGCSKHRSRFVPPSTPEHFWDVGFPDTPTCHERGYIKTTADVEKDEASRPTFRRRRGYRKIFKSKNEDQVH